MLNDDLGIYKAVDTYGTNEQQASRPEFQDFNKLSQQIIENVQKFTSNNSQIQNMINLIDTSSDNPDLRDKLHRLQLLNSQLGKTTLTQLHDLCEIKIPSAQKHLRLRKDKLTSDFSKVLNNFQELQQKQKEKEKKAIQKVKLENKSRDIFGEEDELTNGQLFGGQQQQLKLSPDKDADFWTLQEREHAVHQLESDISDVNQMFKDLSLIIHQQGEVVDSIEANIDVAGDRVSRGRDELRKASQYQSKARRRKFIIFLVAVIILIILIIIISVAASK